MRTAKAFILLIGLTLSSGPLVAQDQEGYLPYGLEYGMSKLQAISSLGAFSEYGEEQEYDAPFNPDRHDVINYFFPGYILSVTIYDGALVGFGSSSNGLSGIEEAMDHHRQVVSEMDGKLGAGLEVVRRRDMCVHYEDDLSHIIASALTVSGRGFSGLSFYEKGYFEENPVPSC